MGAGTTSGEGLYVEGAPVTVTATPATGYRFVNWTEDGLIVSTDATCSFTMGDTGRLLRANF